MWFTLILTNINSIVIFYLKRLMKIWGEWFRDCFIPLWKRCNYTNYELNHKIYFKKITSILRNACHFLKFIALVTSKFRIIRIKILTIRCKKCLIICVPFFSIYIIYVSVAWVSGKKGTDFYFADIFKIHFLFIVISLLNVFCFKHLFQ